jgi:hypothetical protein
MRFVIETRIGFPCAEKVPHSRDLISKTKYAAKLTIKERFLRREEIHKGSDVEIRFTEYLSFLAMQTF